jgi:hypothetical protein
MLVYQRVKHVSAPKIWTFPSFPREKEKAGFDDLINKSNKRVALTKKVC